MEEKDEVERKIKNMSKVSTIKFYLHVSYQIEGTKNSPKKILTHPKHTKHPFKGVLSPSPVA